MTKNYFNIYLEFMYLKEIQTGRTLKGAMNYKINFIGYAFFKC